VRGDHSPLCTVKVKEGGKGTRREERTQALQLCSRVSRRGTTVKRNQVVYKIEGSGKVSQFSYSVGSMHVQLEVKPDSNAGAQDDHFARAQHTILYFFSTGACVVDFVSHYVRSLPFFAYH
jgi:hypothetical protein